MDEAREVLEFWFGAPDSEAYGAHREMWFEGGPEVDARIAERFGALYERAAAGELDHWRGDAGSALALIVLLDQFPRNMFRGTARAFAADGKAVALARHAVAQGYDRDVGYNIQQFYYLPFEHSEDLADQRTSVELFRACAEDDLKEEGIRYAVQHLEIVERFGRFPHRNAILGRESTAEELTFLEDGGEDVHFGTLPKDRTEVSADD